MVNSGRINKKVGNSQPIYVNGIEITSNLIFRGWHSGFEYTKNINFKNMNTRSVRLIYNVPTTKFFTTLFSKVISLSPGTTFSLPITFRPVDMVNYDDYLEVNIIDFQKLLRIKLSAKLPQHKIELQPFLDMGSTCVDDFSSTNIRIKNESDLDTLFEWDICEPFAVSPSNGEIKAHSFTDVTISFYPKAAVVYKGSAVLRYGGQKYDNLNLFKTTELTAVGKYPHILIEYINSSNSETVFDNDATLTFGKVLIGQSLTQYFTLVNMTEVKTNYFIEKNDSIPLFDKNFNCSQHIGTLKPFEKQKIPITYSPCYPSTDAFHDYFYVYSTNKYSKNVITCIAENDVPIVRIVNNFINFGLCNVGDKIFKTFELKNHSKSSTAFQFDIDNLYSSFKFSITNGILKPFESILVQVKFEPIHPIIFFKRIPCLIQNHDVLYVNLIGTAHTELMKPPIMNKAHLNLYYYLKNKNLLIYSPEQLTDLCSNQKIDIPFEKLNQEQPSESDMNLSNDFYINDGYHETVETNNINNNKILTSNNVYLDNYYVDFNASKVDDFDENFTQEKSITLQNQTKAKIIVFWSNFEREPFSVFPNTCEVPPMKSYSFRVRFKPLRPDQFYKAKLECFAIFKSLSDYTLVDPKFALPAWELCLECMGHTFNPSNEKLFFTPKYRLDTDNIIFPASVKDKHIYRTLLVKNISNDYPLVYDFTNFLSSLNCIQVKPHQGLVEKNQHQLIIFKFVPKDDSYLIEKCNITLNYMPQRHILEVGLIGVGLFPNISFENNGILYFAPTCKRKQTYQTFEITNLTRGRLEYEWKIPYESKNIFSVDFCKSVLQPYEKKKCLWKYSPNKIDKYNHKISMVTWVTGNEKVTKTYNLRILAACTQGSLQSNDKYKDFGSVIVGSSISSEILIINNNDCSLDYELFVDQSIENVDQKLKNEICILELEQNKGHIEARSRHSIRCRLRPTRLMNYQFVIYYKIAYSERLEDEINLEEIDQTENGDDDSASKVKIEKDKKEVLCYLTANGVYPKLKVTDIKGLGPASSLSKDYLWKLLAINELNTSMSCEPNPDELIYSIATRQETSKRAASSKMTSQRPIIDLNFNAAPLNSEDTQIIMFVENTGLVPTDWVMLFPKDLLLELEYWAQSGEFDIEELEQMKVQDNRLFKIEPKSGHLEAGETVRISLTYRHVFTGLSKLPVLLKIAKGREIMLNLTGATSPKNECYLYFPSTKFEFEPLEIGLTEYPLQIYELYNGGDVDAYVEIDCSSLEYLNAENYMHSILTCVTNIENGNKPICIPPGTCYETKWRFSPIEARTYQCDIVFKTNQCAFNAVSFKLIGYDKRKLNNALVTTNNQEIPNKQAFILPNQLATLSLERIVLGDVPLFSRERKIIFIKNNSNQHKISFTWHVTNPDHVKFIRIQPSRGQIDINQSKMCKITFISKEKAAFYNIDLICEIKNETEMQKYKNEIENWRNEQNRQFEEFIIEENELESRLEKVEMTSRNLMSGHSRTFNEKTNANSQLAIHKFKTIPPIVKNNVIHETNVSRIKRSREEKKTWKKPIPPNPFLLHLNVLARTQYFDDYLDATNGYKTNSLKFVDSLLGKSNFKDEKNKDIEKVGKLYCLEKESESIDFILSDLIRNLISDKSFHLLIQKIKDEEIPYFFQYSPETVEATSYNENDILSAKKKQKSKSKSSSTVLIPKKTDLNDNLKTSPIFCSLIENIFENTLSNIMTEAFGKEFNLTSRPRLIALPPKQMSPLIEQMQIQQTENQTFSPTMASNLSNQSINTFSISKSKTALNTSNEANNQNVNTNPNNISIDNSQILSVESQGDLISTTIVGSTNLQPVA